MPGIKVVDLAVNQPHRRAQLWEAFGALLKTNPTNIKDEGKGTFYVIVPQDKVEQVISQESKDKLKDKQFITHTPIEYNAMRTIIIRHLDKVMAEFTDKEIADNIEQSNSWAKVETVVKLMNTVRMLKVRFYTTDMAERALRDGIIVIYQNIPPPPAKLRKKLSLD